MKGVPKPCPYCSNPDLATWTQSCAYVGPWSSHAAFVQSTFDPPCALDAEDQLQRELDRANRNRLGGLVLAAGFAWLGVIIIAWGIHKGLQ